MLHSANFSAAVSCVPAYQRRAPLRHAPQCELQRCRVLCSRLSTAGSIVAGRGSSRSTGSCRCSRLSTAGSIAAATRSVYSRWISAVPAYQRRAPLRLPSPAPGTGSPGLCSRLSTAGSIAVRASTRSPPTSTALFPPINGGLHCDPLRNPDSTAAPASPGSTPALAMTSDPFSIGRSPWPPPRCRNRKGLPVPPFSDRPARIGPPCGRGPSRPMPGLARQEAAAVPACTAGSCSAAGIGGARGPASGIPRRPRPLR